MAYNWDERIETTPGNIEHLNIALNLPFYSNTPDGTHCFQAVLKMVLAHFLPDRTYTWVELDNISSKREGLWTWPTAAVVALKELGFDILLVEEFDYRRFAEDAEKYLLEKYGEEVARAQINNSDIVQERQLARKLIEEVRPIIAVPSFTDIKRLMSQEYVVVCNVNSRLLNNKDGYAGHFVLVTGIGDEQIIVHDPGIPPSPNRKIPREVFEKAWGYPLGKTKNVIAFKLL